MNHEQVMRQALEALELHAKQYPHMQKGYTVDAITALRAALAEPVQEPVFEVGFGWLDDATKYPRGTKLYVAPPQRKPLTEEQKLDLVTNWFSEDWAIKNALGLLDDYDTLRAYGIGE